MSISINVKCELCENIEETAQNNIVNARIKTEAKGWGLLQVVSNNHFIDVCDSCFSDINDPPPKP